MSTNINRSNSASWYSISDPRMSSTPYQTVEIPEIKRMSDLDIRRSFDVLNERTINIENKLNSTLRLIDELKAKNKEQDEMIEYLKDVANKEI